jgi:hypothetical protein
LFSYYSALERHRFYEFQKRRSADRVGEAAGYAAEALWKTSVSPPVATRGHPRLLSERFYLQGRELAPRAWTVMLDEAQDADPVILGLVECVIAGHALFWTLGISNSISGEARLRAAPSVLGRCRTFAHANL